MALRAAAISSLALCFNDCLHIKKANERMKKLIFLIMLISSVHGSFSQQKTIQGKVSGEAGPLEGVSIQVRGSNAGYQTDKNGSFSVPVSGTTNQLLVFSAIGYKTYSISAKPGATLSVSLEKTESTLEDVVVVGYNSVKRKDLTGSVSSVSAKQIKDVPLSNAARSPSRSIGGCAGAEFRRGSGC